MKAIVVYDEDGNILNIIYSVDGVNGAPKGVPYIVVDLPVGSTITGLEMPKEEGEKPTPLFTYWPAIDMETIRTDIKGIKSTQDQHMHSIAQNTDDIDIVELALAEMYEAGIESVERVMASSISAAPEFEGQLKKYSAIVKLYARLVQKHLKSIENVPADIKADVEEYLKETRM